MDDQWPALVVELNTQVGASRDTAQQWADLGQERGWSVDGTRQLAAECIAFGVSPADYRRATPWDELDTATRQLAVELRKPFVWILDRLIRLPGLRREADRE